MQFNNLLKNKMQSNNTLKGVKIFVSLMGVHFMCKLLFDLTKLSVIFFFFWIMMSVCLLYYQISRINV